MTWRLQYSKEKPTHPGFYWCMNANPEHESGQWEAVVVIEESALGLLCSWLTGTGKADVMIEKEWSPDALWAGPIPRPEMPA